MSAQISRPIGMLASSALFALGALTVPNTAFAVDCLTAPNSSAPPNSHWYYRTDRTQQRKCWYLRGENQASEQGAVQAAAEPSPPVARPYSLERFKDFMAQQRGPKLSDQDVEKLYGEFLAWSRDNKN